VVSAAWFTLSVRLHVEILGDGRPLVLLPSFSLDHAAMAAAIEPVLPPQMGWKRIYVDLPGTGSSARGDPRSDAVLDDLIDTLRSELRKSPFALTGWSYGGYLAAAVARRLPGQVGGLMMVCSGFKIREQDRDLTGVLESAPEPNWLEGVPARLRAHFTHAVGRQTAEVAERIVSVLSRNRPNDDEYLTALRTEGFAVSDEDVPTACDAPVCFMTGQRDRVAGYIGLLEAMRHYEHANAVTAGRAGHYLPIEEPTLFGATLRAWLAECETRVV
jgi:pimeloyl-ACP methyl ester carboxylesterase